MTKTIETETLHIGAIFNVRRDTIDENGLIYERDIVEHRGSAVIVPLFEDGTIAMVRQYRHAAGEHLLELPAGSLEPGEDALTAAARELEEEIGYRAGLMTKITEFYVSPGFLTEKMHVYLAEELSQTKQDLDADEIIDVERYLIDDAAEMIRDGRIVDAKTMLGLYAALNNRS